MGEQVDRQDRAAGPGRPGPGRRSGPRRRAWVGTLVLAGAVALSGAPAASAHAVRPVRGSGGGHGSGSGSVCKGGPVLVSVGLHGQPANSGSERPSVGGRNGDLVAFSSNASNLVPGDRNGRSDVFVRDLKRGTTELVSVNSRGQQGNGGTANDPMISSSGRYVVFSSDSTNLVPGVHDGLTHIYLRDLKRGTTTLVDAAADGTPSNGPADRPTLDAAGDAVSFVSYGSNLTPGDAFEGPEVYVKDLRTGAVTKVSVNSAGQQAIGTVDGGVISPDGRYVTFISMALNLVPGVSGKGDLFLHDRVTGKTTLVSTGTEGQLGDDLSVGATFSSDDRYIAFASHATTLTPNSPTTHDSHLFVRDLKLGTTTLIDLTPTGAVGNSGAFWNNINASGSYTAFVSAASNLVAGDTNGWRDIFVRNLGNGATERISVAANGTQGDQTSVYPSVDPGFNTVAYMSYADNLTSGTASGLANVFACRI